MQERIGLSGMLHLCVLGSPYRMPKREPVGNSSL